MSNLAIVKHSLGGELGGPAESFEKFLINMEESFYVVSHPLNRESVQLTTIKKFTDGIVVSEVKIKRRYFGIINYLIDVFFTPKFKDLGTVVCFNPWSVLLVKIRFKRIKKLVFWGVDLHPRLKKLSFYQNMFYLIENLSLKFVSLQIENNRFALEKRREYSPYLLRKNINSLVVPITHDIKLEIHRHLEKSVINMLYIGAIDQRNGTLFFIEIAKLLKKYRNRFTFHIIGTGASLPIFQSMVNQLDISENFIFYKNLSIQEIINISKKIDLALAPYEFNKNSFSVYADPGKLVLYSALGLPVIVNRAPLMVKEYEEQAGFIGMNEDDDSVVWAKKIIELKSDSDLSTKLAQMSKNYGEKRKSEYVYSKLFARLIENDG